MHSVKIKFSVRALSAGCWDCPVTTSEKVTATCNDATANDVRAYSSDKDVSATCQAAIVAIICALSSGLRIRYHRVAVILVIRECATCKKTENGSFFLSKPD